MRSRTQANSVALFSLLEPRAVRRLRTRVTAGLFRRLARGVGQGTRVCVSCGMKMRAPIVLVLVCVYVFVCVCGGGGVGWGGLLCIFQ